MERMDSDHMSLVVELKEGEEERREEEKRENQPEKNGERICQNQELQNYWEKTNSMKWNKKTTGTSMEEKWETLKLIVYT